MAHDEPRAPRIVEMRMGASMSFAEIAAFRAVVLLPHVPYALRLSDVFALSLPAFVPAHPLLHKFMWPYAGPFCGRTDPALSRSVDEQSLNRSSPPYSPFDFQGSGLRPDQFHNDR